jgi:hypothetical protein
MDGARRPRSERIFRPMNHETTTLQADEAKIRALFEDLLGD